MAWPVVQGSAQSHAVVVVHGMQQKARHMFAFGQALGAGSSPPFNVYAFGYNWNNPIAGNGAILAKWLDTLSYDRLDLVGYSMGGLVSRVAAARGGGGDRLQTIVTIATPNRGALRTSDLSVAQQAVVVGLTGNPMVSPLLVWKPGVANLLAVDALARSERDKLLASGTHTVAGKRYASIPALFYNQNRLSWAKGPSGLMSKATALFGGLLRALNRPHDGIVREESADLTRGSSVDWAEFDLCDASLGTGAPLCHAVPLESLDHDHLSIMASSSVIDLVRRMVVSHSWEDVASDASIQHSTKITLGRPL